DREGGGRPAASGEGGGQGVRGAPHAEERRARAELRGGGAIDSREARAGSAARQRERRPSPAPHEIPRAGRRRGPREGPGRPGGRGRARSPERRRRRRRDPLTSDRARGVLIRRAMATAPLIKPSTLLRANDR